MRLAHGAGRGGYDGNVAGVADSSNLAHSNLAHSALQLGVLERNFSAT
jgi:hypothetical protein